MPNALDDVRVVDLTNGLAGTSATKLLAAMGAEVIKVENPAGGDMTRNLVPWVFEAYNGGKRSLTADLREHAGRDIVRSLVRSSDVLVQSMRPGALEEIGLGRTEMSVLNPRLIYASFSAFGSSGPSSQRRGVDSVLQAESGLASVQGRVIDNVSPIDAAGGLALSNGILAALMLRERTGAVQHVDVNLLDTAIYLQSAPYAEFSVTGTTFDQRAFDETFPLVGTFDAADGPLYIAAYWDRDFSTMCAMMDRPELVEDKRFRDAASRAANRASLRAEVSASLQRRPRSEWVDELVRNGILAGEARSFADVLADEQVERNETFETVELAGKGVASIPRPPFKFPGRPAFKLGPAPALGADNETILAFLRDAVTTTRSK
jgi:CoA:oxalate CoA-transferase